MLLVGTLVLAIGVAVFLYLLLRRKRKAPAAQAATPTAEPTPNQDDAAKPLALAYPVSASSVRASFQQALRFLRAHVPVRDYRYRLPWYLVAGEPGAGKTNLLNSVSLNLPQQQRSDDNGQRTGLNWFFFDRAVMLEVEGDTDAVESEKQWRRILRELVRVRPEQPIEGLILAIPCTDLLPRNALDRGLDARVSELALRWQERLIDMQRMLGLTFPVYVLVTKCDRLEGFRDFCQPLPERFREEMLGWSNPYSVDTTFTPTWLPDAFQELREQLYRLQMELFASAGTASDADELFLFPDALFALQPALSLLLSQVFRPGAWRQAPALRGIYFCGDGSAAAVARNGRSGQPGRTAKPVFVQHVLEKAIAERALARPLAGVWLAKNRLVAVLQILLVGFLLIGGSGLFFAQRRLAETKRNLDLTLTKVDSGLSRLQRSQEPHLYRDISYDVRKHLVDVGANRFGSVFIPSSWFSPINENLTQALTPAFSQIVLESLRLDLDERTRRVVSDNDYLHAADFIQEFEQLRINRERYKEIRQPGEAALDELRALFEYLGQPHQLEHFSGGRAGFYRAALANAEGEELATRATQPGIKKLTQMIDGMYEGALSPATPQTFRRNDALGYLDEVLETEQLLNTPKLTWLASQKFGATSPFRDLTLIAGVQELRSALEDLTQEQFMLPAASVAPVRRSGGRLLLWDPAPLQEAIALYESYDGFQQKALSTPSEELRDTLSDKATFKLKENLEALLRRAKTNSQSMPLDGSDALLAEIRSFREADEQLGKVAAIFDQLGLTANYDRIVTSEAVGLLEKVNQRFLTEKFYLSNKDGFGWWDGSQPLSLTAYDANSTEELTAQLATYRAQIALQAREYAAPLINFLTKRNYGATLAQLNASARGVNWPDIVTQLDKYDKTVPSSVAQLENFILLDMDKVAPGQCPKMPPGSARSSDFFLRTRIQLSRQLAQRCQVLTDQTYFRRYAELQEYFEQHLAGRFPFARPTGEQPTLEADPDAIAEFYRLFDNAGKNLPDALGKHTELEVSVAQARVFLAEMEDLRGLLLPLLTKNGPPLADLEIKFRVNQRREIGAQQIIEWQFDVGREVIRNRDAVRTLRWRLGDPLRLSLRWAKDSPDAPQLTGQAPHVKVQDRTVTFEFTNRWSLLALLTKHLAPVADHDPLAAPDPHLLAFTVKTHAGARTLNPAPSVPLKAFIRVSVLAPGKKENLPLPYFPTFAPRLDRGLLIKR